MAVFQFGFFEEVPTQKNTHLHFKVFRPFVSRFYLQVTGKAATVLLAGDLRDLRIYERIYNFEAYVRHSILWIPVTQVGNQPFSFSLLHRVVPLVTYGNLFAFWMLGAQCRLTTGGFNKRRALPRLFLETQGGHGGYFCQRARDHFGDGLRS